MFKKMAGWSALVITAMVCVATSRADTRPSFGSMEKDMSDLVALAPGQILIKRYTVLLAASSNLANDAGVTRTATLAIVEPGGCVLESDGGGTCPPDGGTTGPVEARFLNGNTQMDVLESCGAAVDCQQTVQVRVRSREDQTQALTVNVLLRAQVTNAGSAAAGLTIVAE